MPTSFPQVAVSGSQVDKWTGALGPCGQNAIGGHIMSGCSHLTRHLHTGRNCQNEQAQNHFRDYQEKNPHRRTYLPLQRGQATCGASAMQSRLWDGRESSNGLVSSNHSWHQGRWENGGKQTKEKVEQNTPAEAAGRTGAEAGAAISANSSTVDGTTRTSHMATSLALSPRENPLTHAISTTTSSSSRARKSRTPRSDSAVEDGRKYLASSPSPTSPKP